LADRSARGRASASFTDIEECMMKLSEIRGLALSAVLVSAFAAPAAAQSVEQFYKGKNLDLYIGYSSGGGYDTYGRFVARHMGKHIPGHPNFVP
jgi:tripartite-type tricarboxylate transporter receptor subunit TctC